MQEMLPANLVSDAVSGGQDFSLSLWTRNVLVNQGVGWFLPYYDMGQGMAALRALIGFNQRDTFVDIGCHKGEVALGYLEACEKLSLANPFLSTLLIDPNPHLSHQIARIRTRFPSVKFVECALGRLEGSARFMVPKSEKASEWVLQLTDNFPGIANIEMIEAQYPVKSFYAVWHDIYGQESLPSFVRMMINRGELDVVRSFGSLIREVKLINFSLNATGYDFGGLYSFFEQSNFVLLRLSRFGFIRVDSAHSMVDKCLLYRNYFAIRADIYEKIS
jgi:hypothetical protein